MNREDQARLRWLRYTRRRRRQILAVLVLVILVLTLGLLKMLGKLPSMTLFIRPTLKIPEGALFVNSGLSRSTLTRTKSISYDFKPQESSTGVAGPAADVVTATLEADLRDPQSNDQFPASLVQLNASPSRPGSIQISTIINPSQQPKPAGGTYLGTIDIFAGTQILRVPIVLYLAPRDGPLATIAFLLLVIGATIGLSVKWITESLTRLAAASWRVEDLRRSLGGSSDGLPLMAAAQLKEIEEAIRRQDTDDNIEKALVPLVSNVSNLRSFAAATRNAKDEVENQYNISQAAWDWDDGAPDALNQDFIESMARAESTCIERLLARDWPWKNPAETVEEAQILADQCSTATSALRDATSGGANSTTSEVLDRFRKGNFVEAVILYRQPPEDLKVTLPSEAVILPKPTKARSRRFSSARGFSSLIPFGDDSPRGLVPWMARRPRAFAAAASVFVVSLVGLQLQYLNAANFAGELGDWLGLLLWSAVVELSGVSVLDVLGRLGTGNVRGGSPPTSRRPCYTQGWDALTRMLLRFGGSAEPV
jgi:hypothetical protein